MQELPTEWSALAAVVLLLGLRHGFDADHLAAIDGLTRYNLRQRRAWASYCGALFSLGHGAVVALIALFVGVASEKWTTPDWLTVSGAWISIAFLILIGVLNLRAILATPSHEVVAPMGVKARFLGCLERADRPLAVALVGALFALSFDTVSQAAMFALAATRSGGTERTLTLSLLFTLGMLITDGVNGLWISRLLARADQIALVASRIMSLAVACASLLVAAFGIARLASPVVEVWSDGRELAVGGAFVAAVSLSYFVARRLGQRRVPPA